MPRKKGDTPASIRIRENQRRSRVRRKELIVELQSRVREFELKGVVAAQEIQQAARKVSQENRQLRVLLHQHGITQEAIERHLRISEGCTALRTTVSHPKSMNHALQIKGSTTTMSQSSQSSNISDELTPGNEPENTARNGSDVSISVLTGQSETPGPSLHQTGEQSPWRPTMQRPDESPTTPKSLQTGPDNNVRGHVGTVSSDCVNAPDCYCPGLAASNASIHGLEMSCTAAAQLIVQMDCGQDWDAARSLLGCWNDEVCKVKNATVLQILGER